MTEHVLDNPIWNSLVTGHRAMSRGGLLAKRFDREVSPLMGIREPSEAAFRALWELLEEGIGALFSREPLATPGDFKVVRTMTILQMVCEAAPSTSHPEIVRLGTADVPDMVALTAATEPGPFGERTIEMGRYYGIRAGDGRLAAMTGERLLFDAFQEVSAVCTHLDFRGRGYAQALVAFVAGQIASEGRTPFLHVRDDNTSARAVYEKLGFRTRCEITVVVLARS